MKKFISIFLLIIGLVSINSCATIVHGDEETIYITTEPSGVKFEVYQILDYNNKMKVFSGETPNAFDLETSEDLLEGAKYLIVIDEPGYKKAEIFIKDDISNWFIFGNLFSWNTLGWAVDAATGAMYVLEPDRINIELIKE